MNVKRRYLLSLFMGLFVGVSLLGFAWSKNVTSLPRCYTEVYEGRLKYILELSDEAEKKRVVGPSIEHDFIIGGFGGHYKIMQGSIQDCDEAKKAVINQEYCTDYIPLISNIIQKDDFFWTHECKSMRCLAVRSVITDEKRAAKYREALQRCKGV